MNIDTIKIFKSMLMSFVEVIIVQWKMPLTMNKLKRCFGDIRRCKQVTIKLNTIEDVNNFVSICSKYDDGEIDVKQNRQIINGKSILGIFSLNLMESLRVIIDSENDNSKIAFYGEIEKWKAGV